jgi:hypothetical protein
VNDVRTDGYAFFYLFLLDALGNRGRRLDGFGFLAFFGGNHFLAKGAPRVKGRQ